jgi:hypothetical protein
MAIKGIGFCNMELRLKVFARGLTHLRAIGDSRIEIETSSQKRASYSKGKSPGEHHQQKVYGGSKQQRQDGQRQSCSYDKSERNMLGQIRSGDDGIRIPKDPNASETSLKYYNSVASSIGRSIATMVDPTNPQRFLHAMASRKKTTPTTFTIYLDDTDTTHLKGQKQVEFTFNAVTEVPPKED